MNGSLQADRRNVPCEDAHSIGALVTDGKERSCADREDDDSSVKFVNGCMACNGRSVAGFLMQETGCTMLPDKIHRFKLVPKNAISVFGVKGKVKRRWEKHIMQLRFV